MTQITLAGPQNNSQEFNTGDGTERGMSPKQIVDNVNSMMTELYTAEALAVAGMGLKSADVIIPAAQVATLFTTPRQVLAAPGAGFANILEGVIVYKAAGTAYAGIAVGEDLSINYTSAAGLALAGIETTGFLDQATAQTRWADAYNQASAISSFTPAENAALMLSLLVGDITTGTSDLKLRLIYRTIPVVL